MWFSVACDDSLRHLPAKRRSAIPQTSGTSSRTPADCLAPLTTCLCNRHIRQSATPRPVSRCRTDRRPRVAPTETFMPALGFGGSSLEWRSASLRRTDEGLSRCMSVIRPRHDELQFGGRIHAVQVQARAAHAPHASAAGPSAHSPRCGGFRPASRLRAAMSRDCECKILALNPQPNYAIIQVFQQKGAT